MEEKSFFVGKESSRRAPLPVFELPFSALDENSDYVIPISVSKTLGVVDHTELDFTEFSKSSGDFCSLVRRLRFALCRINEERIF